MENERRLYHSVGSSLCTCIRLYQYKNCKENFLIKKKVEAIVAGGFPPHWVSTLYLLFMCVIVCSVLTTPSYCLYSSDALIKDQHMMN